jgi:hypothetical protein
MEIRGQVLAMGKGRKGFGNREENGGTCPAVCAGGLDEVT